MKEVPSLPASFFLGGDKFKGMLEQTIKPKHEVSGSQHDNTMFLLGTEAPMVAALGRCGSLRDTCAAIHLSNKKRS